MKHHLVQTLDTIPQCSGTAVTVGSFDGVHIGHSTIIRSLCELAHARDLTSVAITFEPHHRIYFGRELRPFLLTDLHEKLSLLDTTPVDAALILPFNRELADLSTREFLEQVLIGRLGAQLLLVGHDQAIGRDQLRGPERIAREAAGLDIEVATVPPVEIVSELVSSTRIRNALTDGDTELALTLLDHPHLLTGHVVHGHARGRQLGYPTANVVLNEPYKLVPASGVYVATAEIVDSAVVDSDITAMLYIGTRPTFDDPRPVIELFLLDWSGDLYDAQLRISIHKRIRGDARFESPNALVEQIRRDEETTRNWFQERKSVAKNT